MHQGILLQTAWSLKLKSPVRPPRWSGCCLLGVLYCQCHPGAREPGRSSVQRGYKIHGIFKVVLPHGLANSIGQPSVRTVSNLKTGLPLTILSAGGCSGGLVHSGLQLICGNPAPTSGCGMITADLKCTGERIQTILSGAVALAYACIGHSGQSYDPNLGVVEIVCVRRRDPRLIVVYDYPKSANLSCRNS